MKLLLLFFIVLLVVIPVIPSVDAYAELIVATGDPASDVLDPLTQQRTFQNPRGLKGYYVFYRDTIAGDDECWFAYSQNSVSWTTGQDVGTAATYDQCSVIFREDTTNNRLVVYFTSTRTTTVIGTGIDVVFRIGAINDNVLTLSWLTSLQTVRASNATENQSHATITQATDGFLHIIFGHTVNQASDRQTVVLCSSQTANPVTNPTWTCTNPAGSDPFAALTAAGINTVSFKPNVIPGISGNDILALRGSCETGDNSCTNSNVEGESSRVVNWDGSTHTFGNSASFSLLTDSLAEERSAVANVTSGRVHLVYPNANTNASSRFIDSPYSSWSSPSLIFTGDTEGVSITTTIGVSKKHWVFYAKDPAGDLFHKTAVDSQSWGAEHITYGNRTETINHPQSQRTVDTDKTAVIPLTWVNTVTNREVWFKIVYIWENQGAIAYKSNTGTCTGAGALTWCPKYREWNGTALDWSSEVELQSTGSPVRFAQLEFSHERRKRVIATVSDDGMLDSYVCTKASCLAQADWTFTNDTQDLWTTAPTGQQRPYDIAFELTSGDLILVYDKVSASSTQDLSFRTMTATATSFGSETNFDDTTSAVTDTVYSFVRLATNMTIGSDKLGLMVLDETGVDALAYIWDGSAFGNEHELTASAASGVFETIGMAFERKSAELIVVAGEGANVRYNRFTTGWQTSALVGGVMTGVGTVEWISLKGQTSLDWDTCCVVDGNAADFVMLTAAGSLNDMATIMWNGTSNTWATGTEHDAGVNNVDARNFNFAWLPSVGEGDFGILMWGTAVNSISTRRMLDVPNTWASTVTVSETGLHSWIQLSDAVTYQETDTVKVLGAALDSTFDIGGLRWDGNGLNPVSTGDGGITSDTVDVTQEHFEVEWQTPLLSNSREVTGTITLTATATAIFTVGSQEFIREVAGTLTFTTTTIRSVALTRVPAQTLTLAATIFREISISILKTQTLTLTTETFKTLAKSFDVTGTVTLSSAIFRVVSLSTVLLQTLTLLAVAIRVVSLSQMLPQTLTLSTLTIASKVFEREFLQTLTFTAVIVRVVSLSNLETATLTFTTAIFRVVSLSRVFTQTITFTTLVIASKAFSITVAQTLTFTTLTVKTIGVFKTLSQTLTFSTVLVRVVNLSVLNTVTLTFTAVIFTAFQGPQAFIRIVEGNLSFLTTVFGPPTPEGGGGGGEELPPFIPPIIPSPGTLFNVLYGYLLTIFIAERAVFLEPFGIRSIADLSNYLTKNWITLFINLGVVGIWYIWRTYEFKLEIFIQEEEKAEKARTST